MDTNEALNSIEIHYRQAEEFRFYLQEEFSRRLKKNSRYSLRSFARDLNLNPGYLSRLISAERRPSAKKLADMLKNIPIDPKSLKKITECQTNPDGKYPLHRLNMDIFTAISDWYHYAILELTIVADFQSDPNWIAKKLDVSVIEVKHAIERLVRLEFLEIDNQGNYKDVSGSVTTVGNEFTNAAMKNLQKTVIEKAGEALESIPYEKRSQSSLTFAYGSDKMQKLKKLIRNFEAEVIKLSEEDNVNPDQVYNLSVSLYPLLREDL